MAAQEDTQLIEKSEMSRPKQNLICKNANCERPVKARGYCSTHYMAWYRAHQGICAENGCSKLAFAKGFCDTHYNRMRRASALNDSGRSSAYSSRPHSRRASVSNDSGRPPMDLSHPAISEFLYQRKPYIPEVRLRRNIPLWEMEEDRKKQGKPRAPATPRSDGWRDANTADRPTISRHRAPSAGEIKDWSNQH